MFFAIFATTGAAAEASDASGKRHNRHHPHQRRRRFPPDQKSQQSSGLGRVSKRTFEHQAEEHLSSPIPNPAEPSSLDPPRLSPRSV